MEIKLKKSELKAFDSELTLSQSETTDLRTLNMNLVIKQLETNMELREMPIEKRILRKQG